MIQRFEFTDNQNSMVKLRQISACLGGYPGTLPVCAPGVRAQEDSNLRLTA